MITRRSAITPVLAALVTTLAAATPPAPPASPRDIDFARDKWDPSAWTVVRQPNQEKPRTFTQHDNALIVTKESFEPDDYKRESDNALLITDTGLDEAQVEVTFKAGPGFNKNSTPGIVISPRIADGVMDRAIGVFVAPYGMVAWSYSPGDPPRPVRYKFAGQLNKTLDPDKPHTLKCRFSKARKSIALQVDDSDTLVLKFIGHPTLGAIDLDLNSKVGIWGCHGTCEFYNLKILPNPTLSFDWPEKQPH